MRRTLKAFVSALLALISLCACAAENPFPEPIEDGEDTRVEIFALNVGKADAILLRVADKTYLIDAGTKKGYSDLAYALDRLNVTWLDGVFLTHTDKDHGGGMEQLAESDIGIGAFYAASIYCEKSEEKHQAVRAASLRGMSVNWLNAGDTVPVSDSCWFSVLGPLTADTADENNNSLVMKLITPEGTALLTGDMEKEAETLLISSGADLSCVYLKVAHHGRDSATSAAFASAASPEIAVISTNTVEEPDSPSPTVIALLEAAGATVYVTQDYELGVGVRLQDGHAYLMEN